MMLGPLLAAALLLACNAPAPAIAVKAGTPLRLMVLNEVSTHTARAGDVFALRVDRPVVVGGVTVVPVGAKAWGEVLLAQGSARAGKGGRLAARLLHLDVRGERIPIASESLAARAAPSRQVVMGQASLGPLALLARGNEAKLKAGDIVEAVFTADLAYDPATAKLEPLPCVR